MERTFALETEDSDVVQALIHPSCKVLGKYCILPCIMLTFLPKFLRENKDVLYTCVVLILYLYKCFKFFYDQKCACALYVGVHFTWQNRYYGNVF